MKAGLLMLGVAVALASPATAQRETQLGSRIAPRKMTAVAQDPRTAVLAGHRMAGCAFLQQRAKVLAALDATSATDAGQRLKAIQTKGTCINLAIVNDFADSQAIRLPNDIYRGMLAEAVIRNVYANRSAEPLERQSTYAEPWFTATGRAVQIDEMSACVAATDPGGVKALLHTPAETQEERAAIAALSPSLGPCLATGTKLMANRQSLRAGLAEAYYHRLAAPPAVAQRQGDKR